jgi:CBS domain-containing protein
LAIALPPHHHSAISDQPLLPHSESTKPDFVNGLIAVRLDADEWQQESKSVPPPGHGALVSRLWCASTMSRQIGYGCRHRTGHRAGARGAVVRTVCHDEADRHGLRPVVGGKIISGASSHLDLDHSGRSIMNAADIMTQPVITVTPETKIAEAARLMLQHRISGLPVVDGKGAVIGIVTEGDLLRRSEIGTERHRPRWVELLIGPGRLARDYVNAHARTVSEVMTESVASVAPHDMLPDVVGLMEKRHVKRVPVIENGRLVGIVSRANLVGALVHTLTRTAAADAAANSSDAQIRERILSIPPANGR